ncbi:exo-alpha-sialidase [Streptomyces sp. NPDC048696]|uniref:exo-alpha-sialidase n=1 Tax=Streptomyces sp. NPDC048696 TaxID=3365585 RepID=UPI0037144082
MSHRVGRSVRERTKPPLPVGTRTRHRNRLLAASTGFATVLFSVVLLAQPAEAAVSNGGFESGSLTGWTSTGTTATVNSGAHSGTYAARVGGTSPTNGDSSIAQTFTTATGENQLSFWYDISCPDTLTYDWATATLRDNTAGTTSTVLAKTCTNGQGWQQATSAVTEGHSYTLTLISHDDNYTGDPTYTLYDDVALTGTTPPPSLTRLSTDPFTNTTSQHATELEPDTFAYGNTVVASSQVGRFTDGGSSDIGWNTSTDGGTTWQHGMLPGITVYQGGSWARVSDPSVAYDAKHGTWMVSGLVLDANVNGAGVSVSRSADGISWQNPVLAVGNDGQGYDKEWIVCDNTATSPFYGNCYVEVDVTSSGNRIILSTSTDGGATWSAPTSPSGSPSGLGGQPLVQPSGTVVVPYSTNGTSIRAFNSTNGGSSWSSTSLVANVSSHGVAGNLRDGEGLPSAEIDGAGKVYVAWQDCRFRSGCPSNDIVYATSTNGTSWSAVTRVPIDATSSSVDHFIPGIGVDKSTSGASARIGLYYYFYPQANCTATTCQLQVGYVSSANSGTSWSAPATLAGPFTLDQIASTTQGSMVGDYISTSVVGGKAVAAFAVGKAPTNGQAFDEALYSAGPQPIAGGPVRSHQSPTYTSPAPTGRAALVTAR